MALRPRRGPQGQEEEWGIEGSVCIAELKATIVLPFAASLKFHRTEKNRSSSRSTIGLLDITDIVLLRNMLGLITPDSILFSRSFARYV